MSRKHMLTIVFALVLALGGAGVGSRPTRAQERGGPTPPRLGFIDGDVSFWRPGAEDWAQAQTNTALAAGDSLYAGEGANFELQVGPRAFVRAGANTELDLESLEPAYTQFKVTGGEAALDVKRLPRGQTLEIDTPGGAFTVDRPGYYRVNVDDHATAFSARRGGFASVVPASGEALDVRDNQQVVLEGTENVQANVSAAADLDPWDRWNYDRTAQLGEAPRSVQYVPPDVAGVDDLDRYGAWRDEPRYGHVWVPRDVPPDWAPYSTGRWVYDPYYEWTWVDEAPWGWCPYHYGRWVNVNGFWGWAPGPIVPAPVYAPALVAFFGAPGVGVSVSVGAPFVSWVALGFGEPVIPWWGGVGFVGAPYWGGWGGPRIVNNVTVSNTTIVNVHNITKFQNLDVHNAVVGMNREQFGRGRVQQVRLDPQHVQQLRPLHGDLGVKPVARSLVASEGRGHRPPERLRARQVVAARAPQDPVERLRAKGLNPAMDAPKPRVVNPHAGPRGGSEGRRQEQRGAGTERPAPPGSIEREGHGAAPPPPPRHERPGVERAGRPPSERPGHGVEGRTTPPPHPAPEHQARPRPERPEHGVQGRATPPSRRPAPEHQARPRPERPTPEARRERPARPERDIPSPQSRHRTAPVPERAPSSNARRERHPRQERQSFAPSGGFVKGGSYANA